MPRQIKKIKSLKTGAFSRSLSLAKLSFGAGARAAGNALGGLLDSEVASKARKKALWIAQASSLVRELGELKGSLMKAGQMLSVYGEHFLPPEINELLRTLQSDSAPVEYKAIEKVLVRNLGMEKLARLEIEEEPCGAASLGQVHKAWLISEAGRGAQTLPRGPALALKIQYPGVEKAIDGDIKALRRLLALGEWLPKLPATDELFEEVRSMLKRETNYALELEMLEFYGEELAGDARYVVPRPYPEFCAKRVLAMSFEEGVALDSPEVAALPQEKRDAIALSVLDLYFRELLVWGRVQTDPHFGNYRIRLPKGGPAEPSLVMYDFGAVRDLGPEFVQPYRRMLQGTFHGDRALFEKACRELKVLFPEDPQELKDLFWKICLQITEPFLPPQPFAWNGTDIMKRLSEDGWTMLKNFPLRSPPREMVFLDRKMAGNFTLLARLGAKIDGRALLAKYL